MKMEQTECSETSAYKFQTPGNHLKESIQNFVYLSHDSTTTIIITIIIIIIIPICKGYIFYVFPYNING